MNLIKGLVLPSLFDKLIYQYYYIHYILFYLLNQEFLLKLQDKIIQKVDIK